MNLLSLKERLQNFTPIGSLRSGLFAEQLSYVDDPHDIVTALCTRRAGKSVAGMSALYLAGMKNPGTILPYITLTRKSAKNIIWPVIAEQNKRHNLNLNLKVSDLTAELPNGSRIELFGADTEAFIDRLLGGKYPKVIIDEAQAFGAHLERLVYDVLQPATMDYQGSILLQGTPGPIPVGMFYELTKEGAPCHRWSVRNNPYIPHAANWIESLKKRRNWADDNPTFLREYCGQWVLDPDSLVYKFARHRNIAPCLPVGNWQFIIGVDFGWNDQTAFCVLAWSRNHPKAYIVECFGRSQLIPSKIAEMTQELMTKYDAIEVIADTGGLGKSITEEMRQRYGLPMRAAEKTEKLTAIETLNGDFIEERIMLLASCAELIEQYGQLTWDSRSHKRVENQQLRNDLCVSGDTIIDTNKGKKRIDNITTDDLVLTRFGYAPVLWVGQTGISETLQICTSDGLMLLCTPDHQIWTEKGFLAAKQLVIGDKLWSKKSNGMEQLGEDTQNLNLDSCEHTFTEYLKQKAKQKCLFYTDVCTNMLTGKYLIITTYITLMVIHLITTSKILSAYQKESTSLCTENRVVKEVQVKRCWNISSVFAHWLLNGTVAQRVKHGTLSMVKKLLVRQEKKLSLFVLSAKNNTQEIKIAQGKDSSALENVLQKIDVILGLITKIESASIVENNSASQNTKQQSIVVKIVPYPIDQRVFNLKTNSLPEFFANGILVHNCDCSLYAARMSRHYWYREPAPTLTSDALARKLERDMMAEVVQQHTQEIRERENDDTVGTGSLFDSPENEWSY